MALTAEHNALPIKIMEDSVAKVIINQPAVMGMVMDIIVFRLPKIEQSGDDMVSFSGSWLSALPLSAAS